MPDISLLGAFNGVRVKGIVQTYLACESSKNARVRRLEENGKVSYIKTVKQRISTLSAYEDEHEISKEEYAAELQLADTTKSPIIKTRYCIPYDKHIIEIDLFPFWNDRAILEVELKSEDEGFSLPDFVEIIKEVSDDKRYKNTYLAQSVPFDEI